MSKIFRVPIIHCPMPEYHPFGYMYMTVDLKRGKKYIGKHKSTVFDVEYFGSNIVIQRALKKRPETLKCFPIDWAQDLNELNEKERYWIAYFNAVESSDYYNILAGGDGGALTGESLERMKNSRKGQGAGEHHWTYGKSMPESTRHKLSEANLGAKSPRSKPVYAFNLQGQLINTYVNRAATSDIPTVVAKISSICCFNERNTDVTKYYKDVVYANNVDYVFAPILEEVTEKGADGKRHHTQAHKDKIAMKSRQFKHTKESKEKLRQSHLGMRLSEETKAKIAQAHLGKMTGENNPNYGGKSMTPDHYKAHSEFMKGKRMSQKTEFTSENASGGKNSQAKAIVQLTLEGNLVQEFDYLAAVQILGFNQENVRNCCKGRRTTYKGYRWMYKTDYDALSTKE